MRQALVKFNDRLAGILREDEYGYHFQYLEEYLKSENPQAVSLTLPLQEKSYNSNVLFPFFDGLIPEGWMLNIAEKKWKISNRDRMGLLLACCQDCIGAVGVFEILKDKV